MVIKIKYIFITFPIYYITMCYEIVIKLSFYELIIWCKKNFKLSCYKLVNAKIQFSDFISRFILKIYLNMIFEVPLDSYAKCTSTEPFKDPHHTAEARMM